MTKTEERWARIYRDTYCISTPRLALHTEEEIDRGVQVGDEGLEDLNNPAIAYLTIFEMAKIVDLGFPLELIKSKDLEKIMQNSEEHLQTRNGLMARQLNQTDDYMTNLKLIDSFLTEISVNNKRTFTKSINDARAISDGQDFSDFIPIRQDRDESYLNPKDFKRRSPLANNKEGKNIYDISNIF